MTPSSIVPSHRTRVNERYGFRSRSLAPFFFFFLFVGVPLSPSGSTAAAAAASSRTGTSLKPLALVPFSLCASFYWVSGAGVVFGGRGEIRKGLVEMLRRGGCFFFFRRDEEKTETGSYPRSRERGKGVDNKGGILRRVYPAQGRSIAGWVGLLPALNMGKVPASYGGEMRTQFLLRHVCTNKSRDGGG